MAVVVDGTYAKNDKGEDIKRPTERRQIEWYRINGDTVLQKVDLPGQWIPVIRCEGNVLDLNGQVRRRGMVRDMMDTQRSARLEFLIVILIVAELVLGAAELWRH